MTSNAIINVPAPSGPFSPSDVAGLKVWLKAEGPFYQDNPPTVLATADGDQVKYWTDSSGQGNHVTAGSDAARTTLKLAILNGKSINRFDGAADILHVTFGAALSQPNWIFIVASSTNEGRMLDGDTAGRHIIDRNAGAWRYFAGASVAGGTGDTSAHYFTGKFNGASSYLRVSGTQQASGDGGSNTYAGVYLGADNSESGLFTGDIAEVLVYNAALTVPNQTSIESYLAAKFAL